MFLCTGASHFSIIFSLFHVFYLSEYKKSFSSIYSICRNFLSVPFPSFSLKNNKGVWFSPDARIVKITANSVFLTLCSDINFLLFGCYHSVDVDIF